jgi:hypothetical protein
MNLSAQRDILVTYPTRELFLNKYCWPKYEIPYHLLQVKEAYSVFKRLSCRNVLNYEPSLPKNYKAPYFLITCVLGK